MNILFQCIQKAEKSKKYLWLLNRLINFAVPFNKPHSFKVTGIAADQVKIFTPYKKKNFNHVRGIHACAIATAGELSAGLLLMFHFNPIQYRMILSHIDITYHYQAKKDIVSTATLTTMEKETILQKLSIDNKTTQDITSEIKDIDNQLIATVKTTWQLKKWSDVKTKR